MKSRSGGRMHGSRLLIGGALSLVGLASALVPACSADTKTGGMCQSGPHAVGTTKTPEFLYATYAGTAVGVYAIDSASGALTEVPGSPLYMNNYPNSVIVNPSGKYALGPGGGGGLGPYGAAFHIEPDNGELSEMASVRYVDKLGQTQPGFAFKVSFDPLDRYSYVTIINVSNSTAPRDIIESRSTTEGLVVASNLAPGAGQPGAAAGEPGGHFVYMTTSPNLLTTGGTSLLSAFGIDPMGKWIEIGGSPFPIEEAGAMAIHPSGKFAYISGVTGVTAYAIDSTKGSWSKIGKITHPGVGTPSGGVGGSFLTVDPKGRFAYALSDEYQISAYLIDQATGALTLSCSVAPVRARDNTQGNNLPITDVAVEPSGLFAYISGIQGVSAYVIDQSSGALSEIAGSPYKYLNAYGKQLGSPVALSTVGLAGAGITPTPPSTPVGVQLGGARQGKMLSLSAKVSTVAGWPHWLGCTDMAGQQPGCAVRSSTDGNGLGARFNSPVGITTDGISLYVTDAVGGTLRKVNPYTRAVTTVAGMQSATTSFVDGMGSAARFGGLDGITTDGKDLYVVDGASIRRVVTSTGQVTTLAGVGETPGMVDGTGSAARFAYPTAITTDGTNLYVSDTGSYTVRRIVISTGEVTTLAGRCMQNGNVTPGPPCFFYSMDGVGTAARLSAGPITTDGSSLYLAGACDLGPCIRKISPSSGNLANMSSATAVVTTILNFPQNAGYAINGISCDGTSLFVTSASNSDSVAINIVFKVDLATLTITPIAGNNAWRGATNGIGVKAAFNVPKGITTDGTSLFVADSSDDSIRRIQ